MPLQAGDRKFGVLVLQTLHRPAKFTESDVPFVQTLADLIALAIDRAGWKTKPPPSATPGKPTACAPR